MMIKKNEWIAVSESGIGWQVRKFIKMDGDDTVCEHPAGNDPVRWKFNKPLQEFIDENEGLK